jgi:hypothetical protein
VLNIDRIDTQMEILPGPPSGGPARPEPGGRDQFLAREEFRVAVLDVLRDHLRKLERSGMA